MSTRTVSDPYVDQSNRKRSTIWVVTVKQGALVQSTKFTDHAEALAFAADAKAVA